MIHTSIFHNNQHDDNNLGYKFFPSSLVTQRQSFSKDELVFSELTPLSFIEIECPICLQVMLKDPHLTSCGHYFCGSCIERVKKSNGACPTCKENNYQTFPDMNRLRMIKGLQVYCTNKKSGCDWKGELKDLIGHINEGKRDGECKFEEVNCRYFRHYELDLYFVVKEAVCSKNDLRHYLDNHEKDECPRRPYKCEHCNYQDIYQNVVEYHYDQCLKYPVPCTNGCSKDGKTYPRESLSSHLNEECPLQPVECQFTWAGCREKPLRKDLPQHINDNMKDHFTLLAVACGEMKKENEEMKNEIEEMKKENKEMKKKSEEMKKENKQIKERNESLVNVLVKKSFLTTKELEKPAQLPTVNILPRPVTELPEWPSTPLFKSGLRRKT